MAGLLTAALFAVYAAGACHTIYVGDSGELVAAVATLGIPHPPGYPLYVLLGKLWTVLVPVGSIAFRMSLFSAATAALACGVLYLVGRRLGLSLGAALLAALLLAFAPSFWHEANVQRVYALGALCLAVALWAVVRWHVEREPRWLVLALFLCGLGAANRTFLGAFGALFGLWAVATERSLWRRPRVLLAGAGAFAAGLAPYLFLLVRSRQDPRLDWGNPETLDSLLGVMTRRDYWERAWVEGWGDVGTVVVDYLAGIGRELFWVGALLALIGLVAACGRSYRGRAGWPVGLFAGGMVINLWMLASHGSRADIFLWHRYYIPSYVFAALFAGFGWHLFAERARQSGGTSRREDGTSRREGGSSFGGPTFGWHLLVLLVPAVMLVAGWSSADRSRYRIADDFNRTLLESLPPGSHLSAQDDNILFPLIYLKLVEGVRPDVDLVMQGVGGAELPELHFDPDEDDVFFTHHPNWDFPALEVEPVGLVYRIARAGRPPPEILVEKERLAGEDDPRVPRDHLTRNLVGHFHFMLGVSHERRDWVRCEREFREAAAAAWGNDVLFYNLGLIYRRNGLHRRALTAFERSAAINPRQILGSKSALASEQAAAERREVERLEALEAELAAHAAMTGLEPGSPTYHLSMAELLERAREALAARGHRLRAREIEAGLD